MQRAFSLVELSIVLVILGLLTGGILAGQSLIRAAELRSVTADYQRYATAVQAFKDKYMAIPGDMTNATRFWGRTAATADCVTNSSAAVATPGTCDGDGDGTLDYPAAASQSAEDFQIWRQLALAGLLEGSYSGYAGSGGIHHSISGDNVPGSKIANGAWFAYYWDVTGSPSFYTMLYGNTFAIGTATAAGWPFGALLSPEEAWNIDTKLDDGKPAYGKIIARFWDNACASADDGSSAADDLAASYRLSDSSKQCMLLFRNAF